jgi:hypothetical protein
VNIDGAELCVSRACVITPEKKAVGRYLVGGCDRTLESMWTCEEKLLYPCRELNAFSSVFRPSMVTIPSCLGLINKQVDEIGVPATRIHVKNGRSCVISTRTGSRFKPEVLVVKGPAADSTDAPQP